MFKLQLCCILAALLFGIVASDGFEYQYEQAVQVDAANGYDLGDDVGPNTFETFQLENIDDLEAKRKFEYTRAKAEPPGDVNTTALDDDTPLIYLLDKSSVEPNAPKDARGASKVLWECFARAWDVWMALLPDFATSLGDNRFNEHLPRFTKKEHDVMIVENRVIMEKMEEIDPSELSQQEHISYEWLLAYLSITIEAGQYNYWRVPITHLGGFHTQFPQLIEYHPFKEEKDANTFLTRISRFGFSIDAMILGMADGITNGQTLSEGSIDRVISQIDHMIVEPKEFPFYTNSRSFRQVGGDLAALEAIIEEIIVPSYQRLKTFMEDSYKPAARQTAGVTSWPLGRALYAHDLRNYTSLNLTPESVHQQGLNEVNRIAEELVEVIQELQESDSSYGNPVRNVDYLQDFYAFIRDDSRSYFNTEGEMLDLFKELSAKAEAKMPEFFGNISEIGMEVVPLPPELGDLTYAMYAPPAQDGSEPGTFVLNTSDPSIRTRYTAESIALHEGYPGHHHQVSVGLGVKGVPRLRNQQHSFLTGYTEGWALYCEKLGLEMGFYEDPIQNYGRLISEMLRAVRLVVDTGLHDLGWSQQEAMEFMKQYTSLPDEEVLSETLRYMSMPGQAVSYKAGEAKIMEIREKASQALGNSFDLKSFHDLLMSEGSVPLPTLEALVDDWIVSQQGVVENPQKERFVYNDR